jgi:hypothetical protein
VKRAAAAAGIKLAAAVPLFLAPPDADTVRLEYRARWNGEAYELTRELAAGDAPSRYSIFDDAAQQQQLFLIDAVLQDPAFSLIIISGLGFTDSLSDLGPTGRREFEGLVGVDLRSWPESIIGEKPTDTPFGPYGRGALWNAWTTWRAMVLHKFLLRIRERMALSPNSPMLAVLADSPYPAHQRQGLNWASAGSPALAENPWLPADYEMTAAGHLLDVLVLGFWQPGLLTSEQTEREGYAWWSSVEGATAAARRYRAPGSEQWAAVPVSPETPWATTARLAGELNDGLMLFSASNFLGDPEAWQLLSLSRPQ